MSSKLTKFTRDSRNILRIRASKLFDSKLYKRQNPDIGRMPAVIHWVSFGKDEDRKLGHTPISEWLLPHLMSGKISSKNARTIKKSVNHWDQLSSIAARLDLNPADYRYLKLIHASKFTQAYQQLTDTSPEVFFDGVYYFASRHMRMDLLKEAYHMPLKSNSDLSRLRHKADIAQALGYDFHKDIRHVIKCLGGLNNFISNQIFKARLPVLSLRSNENLKYISALNEVGLLDVNKDTAGRAGDFARSVAEYDKLLTAATYNSIFSSPVCLSGNSPEDCEIKTVKESKGTKIKLRVLMPNYWVPPQSDDPVTGGALSVQKNLVREMLAQGRTIVPFFATPLFDITEEKNYGLPTVSYHTITRHIKKEPYIHFKEAYLPDYFTHDSRGYSGWSSIAEKKSPRSAAEKSICEKFHSSLFTKYCLGRTSKYEQKSDNVSLPKSPFFFAALQVPDDTVAYWSHMPRSEWLATLCEFGKLHNIPVVIKFHPKDKSADITQLQKTFLRFDNVTISEANIHDLIANCLAVVTVNSGVGFEALLHHKPVITCGRSDYSGVTYEVKSSEELSYALGKTSQSLPPATNSEINQFLYTYAHDHCWLNSRQGNGETPFFDLNI